MALASSQKAQTEPWISTKYGFGVLELGTPRTGFVDSFESMPGRHGPLCSRPRFPQYTLGRRAGALTSSTVLNFMSQDALLSWVRDVRRHGEIMKGCD
jgi:hypothetical protein